MAAICSCFAAWSTWCTLGAVTIALVFIPTALHFARKWLPRKFECLKIFYVWLGAFVVLGGTWAFFLPIALNSGFNKNDDGPVLRQLLIYATGGLLGAITLGETRRKNDQEHIRQVHAERRSRYAKAIEQLADEKAPIRLGGVYTLVKLVDDWMDDEKTLPSKDKRRQEGQIIIDSLCAYIRSSFPLAERHEELSSDYEDYKKKCQNNKIKIYIPQSYKNSIKDFSFGHKNSKYNNQPIQSREDFVRDKSLFQEEQEVRKTILSEIKNRLNGGKVKNKEITPGTWSYFEYNFSDAHFFYAVNFNNSYFGASLNFLGATFTENADVSNATFQRADFPGAHFKDYADFTFATFQRADFSGAHFKDRAFFTNATFATFQRADFSWAEFTKDANFFSAKFTNAKFSGAKFTGDADFYWAKFTGDADFYWAKFTKDAIFLLAEFTKGADFSWAKFTKGADFSWAKFTKKANFFEATFEEKPIFERALGDKTCKARFSCKADPEDYNFKVSLNSPCIIDTKEQEHNGVKFMIPKGTELFDPDEPSE